VKKLLFCTLTAFLVSCGIDDYFYLYPVPDGNVQSQSNTMAVIYLPNINLQEFYYFTHFTIYYRIYISDIQSVSLQLSQSELSAINPALSSDYFGIFPYTTSNTQGSQVVNTSISTMFRNRNYYTLELEGVDIENNILSTSSLGDTITLDFSPTPGSIPFLSINNSARYHLFRSNGNGVFNPLPVDRYFFNSSQLNSSENVTSNINADVVDKNNISGPRYTYVSMYIVATGIDNNFSPIDSIPTFINIFVLPDSI
jgi:hypothetical protein